jgi:hypothetical protein
VRYLNDNGGPLDAKGVALDLFNNMVYVADAGANRIYNLLAQTTLAGGGAGSQMVRGLQPLSMAPQVWRRIHRAIYMWRMRVII